MQKKSFDFRFALLLCLCSLVLFGLQILFFGSLRDTGFYLLQDLAFLPLQVLLVTLVLSSFLDRRAKQERLKKMNMVISSFYSEVGTEFLKAFIHHNQLKEPIPQHYLLQANWTNAQFENAMETHYASPLPLMLNRRDFSELKPTFIGARTFLLSLLENANLLEHENFSDMLWAVFHLIDELSCRDDFMSIPDRDLEHLIIDSKRAFTALSMEWVRYMKHLKSDYPYLFSLALRKNPFDANAHVIFTDKE